MNNISININVKLNQILDYMNNSPIGYILIDGNGKIVGVNHLFLKASHYSLNNIINQCYDKVISYDGTREEFIEKLDSYSSNTSSIMSWRNSAGAINYSKVFIWKFHTKEKLYALGFLEINKEKQTDLLSRFAESFVLENYIGLIIIDKNLHIAEISPLACKLLNVSRDETINRVIDEVFQGIQDEHRVVQRALLEGITVNNYATIWTINQQKFNLLMDSNIIKDDNGVITGAYVVFKDVTNLRSLEQQVRQNDRLKTIGQIAAGTAHEIRNPLTSIKGFLQIIKNTLVENGLLNELEYTNVMLSEIERINKLVNEILLLSKPKDVVYKPTDVNLVLNEVLPIINNEGLLYGIEVNYDLDKSIPHVIADSELLKQVFLNVAKNGIEAMVDGGTLTITTRVNLENRWVDISIHDTGPGIANYIVDKIFEPFFTTKETGTGLGLSICQKIIHDISGNIRISNKGYGTTFQILIPYI